MNVGKDANVVVLFGNGAIEMFAPLVERWSQILLPGQWRGFQFYLVGTEPPDPGKFSQLDNKLVNNRNTTFYCFEDEPPTSGDFYAAIGDKIETSDRVHIHLVCDSDAGEIDYSWVERMVRSASEISSLTFDYTYYLVLGRNRSPAERDGMISLTKTAQGSTILIGEENSHSGRVPLENRRNAVILTVLLNGSGELILEHSVVYSVGYSALNANGAELKRMRESTVCSALNDLLAHPITSAAELGQLLDIFPEGVSSTSEIRDWLENYTRQHLKKPSATALKNAWVTTRFDPELPPSEAVKRMRRFVDLNYTGDQAIGEEAKELGWRTESAVREQFCHSILTACISEKVMNEIAESFGKLARDAVQPNSCTYPPKTLKQRFGGGKEEYLADCKKAVLRSIEAYMVDSNLSVYATEMEACYRRLGKWLQRAQDKNGYDQSGTANHLVQEIQSELNSNEAGDLLRLETKYDDYAAALGKLNLTLGDLVRNVDRPFYQKDGTLSEEEWRAFITQAGMNAEAKMPQEFRGEFFRVLNAELSTQEEREKFFDEYLYMGTRMYYNLKAVSSNGISYYLADQRLTDHWFNEKEHIYKARTDNAENLTLYPVGRLSTEEYLSDDAVYFKQDSGGRSSTGRRLFTDAFANREKKESGPRTSRYDLFGEKTGRTTDQPNPKSPQQEQEKRPAGQNNVRLVPDDKNEYRLYWEWNGNDETAMVEIRQYGEKVGKIAVIPVKQFKQNGDNMNVTTAVMAGKPIPAGTLSVTIRDQNMNILVNDAEVPGRREVVRYKVNATSLELLPRTRSIVDKLVLRTTATDGTVTYYPLYAAQDGEVWTYRGLNLSDGAVVEEPSQANGEIIPIDMGK